MAMVSEADPERHVRSPSTSVPFPRIIQLTSYVYVPYQDRTAGNETGLATSRDVLDRDKRTCVYCGEGWRDHRRSRHAALARRPQQLGEPRRLLHGLQPEQGRSEA